MSQALTTTLELARTLETSRQQLDTLKRDIIKSFGIDTTLNINISSHTDCYYKFNKSNRTVLIYNSEDVQQAIKDDKPKTILEYQNNNVFYSSDNKCVGILISQHEFSRLTNYYVLYIFDVDKEISFTENSVGTLIQKLSILDPRKTILVQLTIDGKTYNSGKLNVVDMGDKSGFVCVNVIADNILPNKYGNNPTPKTVGELKRTT